MRKLFLAAALFITITATAQQSDKVVAYIQQYRGIAMQEMQRTGVPAAIKLAQAILESNAGDGDLALRSNNHFGIKCKTGYTGPYVLHDDDRPQERFIKYEHPEASFRDHSDFLKGRDRYAFLFELDPTDYKAWANGLKKAGYATNPKYPQLLIGLIERYNLEDYTLIAMGKKEMPPELKATFAVVNEAREEAVPVKKAKQYPQGDFMINQTKVIFAKQGTAFEAIATRYNIPLNRLFLYNDLQEHQAPQQDALVFLQLKRTESPKAFHEVEAGETLYDIAQEEGVRLESLLKYNNLTKFASPAIGSKLYLQDMGTGKNAVAKNNP
ncbi:Flagellum-specific peptidoglycan hydrolase FlgJ [Niabella drilacis]|uniref:Peptidoglycan hydrolase n=2 Tax=Niabella drilacis (strain DSM 25811 / CCM 8410 / CCUG 62505 / LMG 26954 / E90) TaxID=1285928 RepID=A0A1G6T234_NIADE|nr:Flagellum-specific peptidoglycan hydrolase FlgJ [Niabella drilacis]